MEETHQGKSSPTIRKLFVAVVLTDFLGMVLLGLDSFGIPHDALRIGNTQLRSYIGNDSHRNIDRVSKEGSQEPECANLNSKAETVVISTTLSNELAIFVVKMKIAGELLRRWFANIASVTLLLFLGKIINRHPVASSLSLGSICSLPRNSGALLGQW